MYSEICFFQKDGGDESGDELYRKYKRKGLKSFCKDIDDYLNYFDYDYILESIVKDIDFIHKDIYNNVSYIKNYIIVDNPTYFSIYYIFSEKEIKDYKERY